MASMLRRGALSGFAASVIALSLTLNAAAAAPERALLRSADYPPATWVPASTANYSNAHRPHDDPISMIVIHDTESNFMSAIRTFQDPNRQGSSHYVVSQIGIVAQMVEEEDIAWHAGNWDYNTRSIGIEHEGYAGSPGSFKVAEYQASARLAASICSRWGVPLDRQHVIGHAEVPDPNHPGLYGGDTHHWDPGPYWNWTYYMNLARGYSSSLPSPPHMMLDPIAVPGDRQVAVTWRAAQSCRTPITGYRVTLQPGNVVQNLPADATTATFSGLTNGTRYTVTVTAINPEGQSSLTSKSFIPFLATMTSYFPWYDWFTSGLRSDYFAVANNGSSDAIVMIRIAGVAPLNFVVAHGASEYVSLPWGSHDGPVIVTADNPVSVSQRVVYKLSFDERAAVPSSGLSTSLVFPWYDWRSPAVKSDYFYVANPGRTTANVTIGLGAATPIQVNIAPGEAAYRTFPRGTSGGPVTVNSDQPILASQRVLYNDSFFEIPATPLSSLSTSLVFPWYDWKTAGFVSDYFYIANPGTNPANVTIAMPGAAAIRMTIAARTTSFDTFPRGTMGGPVTITSDQPVLASQRVVYNTSGNEVAAVPSSLAATTLHFPWYHLDSPYMKSDQVMVANTGATVAHVTLSLPGESPITLTVAPQTTSYRSFPFGTSAGPLTVTSDAPVHVSQRTIFAGDFEEFAAPG